MHVRPTGAPTGARGTRRSGCSPLPVSLPGRIRPAAGPAGVLVVTRVLRLNAVLRTVLHRSRDAARP